MSDKLAAAIESLKSGTPIELEGGEVGEVESTVSEESDTTQDQSTDSSPQDVSQETTSEEGTEEGQDTLDKKVLNPKKAAAEEEMIIKGPDGKPQKLKVNWEDREGLKKYIHAAAGMRMFQQERDRIKQEYASLQKKHQDVDSSWNAVAKAYREDGVRGLVNLLTNSQDGYDRFLASEVTKHQRRLEASPDELRQMELEDRLARMEKEKARQEQQLQETLSQAQKEKEESLKAEFLSRVNPVFDRVRFAGKLGDAQAEAALDKSVWTQTMANLEAYPEDVELTPAIIEKEFKSVASTYRKVINAQAENKTKQVLTQKKTNAAVSAAAMASKGYKQNQDVDAFKQNIRSGNLTDALKAFVSGKVKI